MLICVACSCRIRVPASIRPGRKISCPKCGERLVVPEDPEAIAAEAFGTETMPKPAVPSWKVPKPIEQPEPVVVKPREISPPIRTVSEATGNPTSIPQWPVYLAAMSALGLLGLVALALLGTHPSTPHPSVEPTRVAAQSTYAPPPTTPLTPSVSTTESVVASQETSEIRTMLEQLESANVKIHAELKGWFERENQRIEERFPGNENVLAAAYKIDLYSDIGNRKAAWDQLLSKSVGAIRQSCDRVWAKYPGNDSVRRQVETIVQRCQQIDRSWGF